MSASRTSSRSGSAHRITVALGPRSYDIVIGAEAPQQLGAVLTGARRVGVVTQAAIADAHGERISETLADAGVETRTFLIGDGEQAKSLRTVDDLCSQLARWPLLRGDAIVALGGGLVGDVAGFTASVYYRGVRVVQVPTSLLAMVDASIGGKTGVNLDQGKNLVGAFHQPSAVLIDPSMLATLPDREYRCGLGEVAKYALMGDVALTELLEGRGVEVAEREPAALAEMVARCATVKADYVARDEFETTGVRAHLNYGHTLAHTIETVADYALAHGEAVAVGLVYAGALAGALERIDSAAVDAHRSLVARLGLPTTAPEGLRADDLLAVMRRDKKAAGGLTFVLAGPRGLERVDDPEPAALASAFAAVGVGS